jgi:ABC-type branched-subunit amino acid transport system ATPase component
MLEVGNLTVRYGGHRALDGVALRVEAGEAVVILGSNGAGKTTLLNTLGGLLEPAAGAEIRFKGQSQVERPAHAIVESGIALVPEGRRLFGPLSVADNLRLGGFPKRARGEEQATLDWVFELFPRLAERRSQRASTMSGGEQQMLAIGRALMTRPELLLLDEPSLGLSPLLTAELFTTLEKLRAANVALLLVEQNARRGLELADRAYILENGEIVIEGAAGSLINDARIAASYLGA